MTSAEGWVRYAWAIENEMAMFGPLYERVSDGYIKQEAKRLLKIWQTEILKLA